MTEKLYDFSGTINAETELALRIDCGEEKPIWFPKSLIEDNRDGTFTIPEWLAIEKGIV